MAKKTSRMLFHLECSECHELNYTTEKSKANTAEKISLKKFCPRCRKHTIHTENPRLK